MVIWITGLSGAGKTTLSEALFALLKPRLPELALIDGDAVRALFGPSLGYHEEDRVVQIQRLQQLGMMMSRQGLIAVVAALYSHPDLLRWNRASFADYFEVLLDAPIDFVKTRDPKGLYQSAAEKTAPQVVGVDIPWHRPENPDLTFDVTGGDSPQILARRLALAVPRLADALALA